MSTTLASAIAVPMRLMTLCVTDAKKFRNIAAPYRPILVAYQCANSAQNIPTASASPITTNMPPQMYALLNSAGRGGSTR